MSFEADLEVDIVMDVAVGMDVVVVGFQCSCGVVREPVVSAMGVKMLDAGFGGRPRRRNILLPSRCHYHKPYCWIKIIVRQLERSFPLRHATEASKVSRADLSDVGDTRDLRFMFTSVTHPCLSIPKLTPTEVRVPAARPTPREGLGDFVLGGLDASDMYSVSTLRGGC